ncbi:MAG: hypothetical protein AB1714_11585 [Acidobacteriota bacterium]
MSKIKRPAFVLAVMTALAGVASAQNMNELSDQEVSNRLTYIQTVLNEGQTKAKVWWYGWLVGYTGATAGQMAFYAATDEQKTKQDMAAGAGTTALGAVGLLIMPMDPARLPNDLRAIPADTPEARRAKLATAESYLRRSAAREASGRSWKVHALAAAVNLGAGLAIGLRHDRPFSDGLITFAVGQLVSEAQIFTQPRRAIRDLREYEGRSDWSSASVRSEAPREWYIGASPSGFVVGLRF